MQTQSLKKKRRRLDEICPGWLKRFMYTDTLLVVNAFFALLAYFTRQPMVGFVPIIISAIVVFLFIDDVTLLFPLLFFAMINIPTSDDITQLFPLIGVFVPVVAGIIFHVFYYRRKLDLGKMFWPQVAITIAMFIGGIGNISAERYAGSLAYMFLLGPILLILYVFFHNYMSDSPYVNSKDYIAKSLVMLGAIIAIQTIAYYAKLDRPPMDWGKYRVVVGWGNANNVATMLCITGPFCFYFIAKDESPILMSLLAALQYAALLLTFSRGGILFGAPIAVVAAIYSLVKTSKRKKVSIIYVAFLIAIFAVIIALRDFVGDVMESLFNRGAGLSNRDLLYKEAWELFLRHPIHGGGMGFDGLYFEPGQIPFYWFHSTVLQVLGSMGIIGAVAFIYFYVVRYRIIGYKLHKDLFRTFLFLSVLGFELYSLIDAGTFIPMPFMVMMLIFSSLCEKDNVRLEKQFGKPKFGQYDPIVLKSSEEKKREEINSEALESGSNGK